MQKNMIYLFYQVVGFILLGKEDDLILENLKMGAELGSKIS